MNMVMKRGHSSVITKAAAKNTSKNRLCENTLSYTLAIQDSDVTPEIALAQLNIPINEHYPGIFAQITNWKGLSDVKSVTSDLSVQII